MKTGHSKLVKCGQSKLVLTHATTELGAPVRKNAQHRQRFRLKEGQDFIIEQICCCDGGLRGVKLSEGHFAVSIDERLLINEHLIVPLQLLILFLALPIITYIYPLIDDDDLNVSFQ